MTPCLNCSYIATWATHVMKPPVLDELERLIRRDPARRGLIAHEELRGALCPNHLSQAANDLAKNGRRVVIATGFFIPAATPPAAETDGPPGAALLAAALHSIGLPTLIVTDERCRRAVEVAARLMDLPASTVTVAGSSINEIDAWFDSTINDPTQPPWTHLIAIERVGPSHTRLSIEQHATAPHPDDLDAFEQLVASTDRDRCFNMRGVCLDDETAPLHRLFERATHTKTVKTVGIGDGGNEIGMGSIPWRELQQRLTNPAIAKIPCRIVTDWTIVAGVSNWGAMALAAATLQLRNQQTNLQPWTAKQQQELLQRLVIDGPAVDGITRLAEATVDGLPFLTYIQPWEGIRRALGLSADD